MIEWMIVSAVLYALGIAGAVWFWLDVGDEYRSAARWRVALAIIVWPGVALVALVALIILGVIWMMEACDAGS